MTGWLVFLTYIAAVNPARLRPALPEYADRVRWAAALAGSILTLVVGAGLVAVSADLLDVLDITPETFRIAAGALAAVTGLRVFGWPDRVDEPELEGWRAAFVPVAFPLLMTPQLAGLIIIYGATESAVLAVGGLATALAAGVAAGLLGHRHPTLWLAAARFLGAVLLLGGLALVVEGIRDV